MRWRPLLLVAAACGCTNRGHVEIVAYYDRNTLPGTPLAGATVAFQDLDGSTSTAVTDHDGRASGDVQPGGMVWLDYVPKQELIAYTDVQPGAILAFGAPPAPQVVHSPIAQMTVLPDPSMTGTGFAAYALCGQPGSPQPSQGVLLQLDDRCTMTVDILAVDGSQYAYLPAQPIIDGGTITVPSSAWKAMDVFQGPVVSGSASAPASVDLMSITVGNAFGVTATYTSNRLPLVGPSLRVRFGITQQDPCDPFVHQIPVEEVSAIVATSATPSVDLDAVAAPYVIGTSCAGETTDDGGGVLVADVTYTSYQWLADSRPVLAWILGPAPPPHLAPPSVLPDSQASARAPAVAGSPWLVRVVSTQGLDPGQLALDPAWPGLGDQPGDSIAFSPDAAGGPY